MVLIDVGREDSCSSKRLSKGILSCSLPFFQVFSKLLFVFTPGALSPGALSCVSSHPPSRGGLLMQDYI